MKRSIFKKIICFALCLSIFSMLTGCTSEKTTAPASNDSVEKTTGPIKPKNGEKYVIGFSNSGLNHPNNVNVQESFVEECKKNGIDYILTDANLESDRQINDIESLIAKNVDAVVMIPNDSVALIPAIKALNKAGIPAITVTRNMPDANLLAYVGADDYLIGRMAGDYIATVLEGKGKVVELQGNLGVSTATARSKGFNDVIKNYPGIKLVAQQPADYQRNKAMNVMETIIQATPDFDAIWATNDEMAGGAVQALKAAGIKDTTIVGCNFQKDGLERLRSGEQAADITFPTFVMGKESVNIAMKYFKGEPVQRNVLVDLDIITKGNVDAFAHTAY